MWKNKNAKNKQNPQTGTSSLSQLCGRRLAQPAGPSAAKFSELAPPLTCTQCPPSSPLPSRRDLRPSLRPSFRVACSRADQSSRPGSEVMTLSPGAGEGAPASPHPRQDRGDGHAHRSPPEGGCPPAVLELRLCWVPSAPTPETSFPYWHRPEPHASTSDPHTDLSSPQTIRHAWQNRPEPLLPERTAWLQAASRDPPV